MLNIGSLILVRVLGVFHSLGFPDDIDLDLAGVFQLGLDLLGNVPGQEDHIVLGDHLGLDHDHRSGKPEGGSEGPGPHRRGGSAVPGRSGRHL